MEKPEQNVGRIQAGNYGKDTSRYATVEYYRWGAVAKKRKDITEIVRILDKNTNRLEISTNDYFF